MSPIAIITGASRQHGIGAAIARELVAAGADVFLTYYHRYDTEVSQFHITPTEMADLVTELQQSGQRVAIMEVDLTQPGAITQLFDQAEAAIGAVNILVNNACHSEQGGIDDLTAESLDRHYAMNVRAMMLLCAEFVKRYRAHHLNAQQPGRIINLTSGQGLTPMPNELAYVATKGAVDAFTYSLSEGIAADGITVNAVDPGITDTGWIPLDLKVQFLESAPMGRIGRPEDAARLVGFLASPKAGWITGQIIRSRGGL